ncbi:MAG: EutN/CcmL family microcompartment protein [Nitratireductor sp.]
MKIARITGSVTATQKDPKLSGLTLLVGDIEDGSGNVLEKSAVMADACSAGAGEYVLVVSGSSARIPAKTAGLPVDLVAIAIIDHIDIRAEAAPSSTSSRRKN